MFRRQFRIGFALSVIGAALPAISFAQSDIGQPKPGRDPKQPIDSAYTAKIKEYTTETFFGSPLVDYLPGSKTIPTPQVILGDIAGAPGKLPYTKEVNDYMRLLAKSTPRVKVFSIGLSEEGREMIAVAVGSEQLMAKYDDNRAKLAKLADPRAIGMDDAQAEKIMADVAPVYYITGTIHSTEAGAPTALMELAYRLAVDESPYIKNIRNNVITLITPVVETDGRDRVVDLYNYKKKHPNDPTPPLVWWGHYVAHDNNRDAMGVTLKLTENVLNTYVDHRAQVLHDLHESEAYLYDNTIGDGPYNAWIDPLLANEWQQIGWYNVQEMTRFGMPGVYAHGTFDTWSPGYLMFIAALHNGVSRLYETFGNGGNADTQDRTLRGADIERTWYNQNPALARASWSMRNNNNYEETGLLVSLNYTANNKHQTLENFYERSKRSILKARAEGPAAWVLPASEASLGRQADLLRVMQKQHVEITRATAAFSVGVSSRRSATPVGAAGGGRNGAGAAAETKEYPAGSYIIRMDQPYSRIADALLDYQYWAPNDPQKSPYDDTGWTFPEGFGVQAVRVADPKVLDVAGTAVTGEIVAQGGGVSGSGTVFAINNNADNQLVTLRYQLKTADFQAAEEPFGSSGQKFNRGTFVINNIPQATLDAAMKALGLKAIALSAAPSVKMHPVRAPRVAIVHAWSNTQTEGWWRIAFDMTKVPYDYISVQDIAATADLRSKWDVIIFPPGTGNEPIDGTDAYGKPIPYKQSVDLPNLGTFASTEDTRKGIGGLEGIIKIRDFLRGGGLVIGATSGAQLAIKQGFAGGVTESTPTKKQVDGTLLRARIMDVTSPITYGMIDGPAVYTSNGASYNGAGGARGGGGGRGGAGGVTGGGVGGGSGGGAGRGGAPTRVTGAGRADEPDIPQGRPLLTASTPPAGGAGGRGGRGGGSADSTAGGTGADSAANGGGAGGRGNATMTMPAELRLRPILRYGDQSELLVSGLLDVGDEIVGRTNLVDSPVGKGHVVLFSFNPMYRGETIGTYPFVFNAIMNFDNLSAGKR